MSIKGSKMMVWAVLAVVLMMTALVPGGPQAEAKSSPMKAAPDTYTVVFNGNGSTSGKMEKISVKKGKNYSLPVNKFKREGYTFKGWTRNRSLIDMKSFQIGKVAFKNRAKVRNLANPGKTVTLYAVWKGSGAVAAADWAKRVIDGKKFHYRYAKTKTGRLTSPPCWFCKPKSKYGKSYNCNLFVAHALHHGAGLGRWTGSAMPGAKGWASHRKSHSMKRGTISKKTVLKKGDVVFKGKSGGHVAILFSVNKNKYVTCEATGARKAGKQRRLYLKKWSKKSFLKRYGKYLRYI